MELLTSTMNIDRPYQIHCRKCTLSIFGTTIDELRTRWNSLTPDAHAQDAVTKLSCAMIEMYGVVRDSLLDDEATRIELRKSCDELDATMRSILEPRTPNTNAPGQ